MKITMKLGWDVGYLEQLGSMMKFFLCMEEVRMLGLSILVLDATSSSAIQIYDISIWERFLVI